jgi:hypothetical protein
MSPQGMPEPLYTTVDGSTHYYDQDALDHYLSFPVCRQEGCPDRIWYKNSHFDESFPEPYRIYCFACAWWNERLDYINSGDSVRAYVVTRQKNNLVLYSYNPDKPMENERKALLGFGGRLWTVAYFTGEVVETNNLWYGGEVPERFRRYFQANARLTNPNVVKGGDGSSSI